MKGSGYEVPCTTAYADYKTWCEEQGHQHKLTLTMFGRDLKAAAQVTRAQVREGLSRPWVYRGIRLRELHEVNDAG